MVLFGGFSRHPGPISKSCRRKCRLISPQDPQPVFKPPTQPFTAPGNTDWFVGWVDGELPSGYTPVVPHRFHDSFYCSRTAGIHHLETDLIPPQTTCSCISCDKFLQPLPFTFIKNWMTTSSQGIWWCAFFPHSLVYLQLLANFLYTVKIRETTHFLAGTAVNMEMLPNLCPAPARIVT